MGFKRSDSIIIERLKKGDFMDKIIFIADYIEPNRKMIFELPEIRQEAFTDIDTAVLHILKNTLEYLDGKTDIIDEMTEETYKYYLRQRNKQ